MNRTKSLLVLFLLGLCTLRIFECIALTSDLDIVADPYQFEDDVVKQWSNDMIRIGITTEERGLVFKIAISNQHETDSLTVESLEIDVRVKYGEEVSSRFLKHIALSYIYLPPRTDHQVFVPVDFGHGDVIGSYKAEVTYTKGSSSEQHIEPYPFEFRVVSEAQFQKEIEQKKGSPIIIIGPFEVKVFDLSIGISVVSVPIVLVLYYLWKKKH